MKLSAEDSSSALGLAAVVLCSFAALWLHFIGLRVSSNCDAMSVTLAATGVDTSHVAQGFEREHRICVAVRDEVRVLSLVLATIGVTGSYLVARGQKLTRRWWRVAALGCSAVVLLVVVLWPLLVVA